MENLPVSLFIETTLTSSPTLPPRNNISSSSQKNEGLDLASATPKQLVLLLHDVNLREEVINQLTKVTRFKPFYLSVYIYMHFEYVLVFVYLFVCVFLSSTLWLFGVCMRYIKVKEVHLCCLSCLLLLFWMIARIHIEFSQNNMIECSISIRDVKTG